MNRNERYVVYHSIRRIPWYTIVYHGIHRILWYTTFNVQNEQKP